MLDEFGFAMNPEGAFAPRWRGGPMRLHGGKGSSAPPPDPRLVEAQMRSMGIQDSAIQEIMANNRRMAPMQEEQLRFGLDSAKTAYGQSQEDRSFMLDRRGGLVTQQDRMLSDANDFNGAGRQDQLGQQATADVGMAFDQARGQQQRNLERSGVNPSSGRAMALGQQSSLEEAKAKAGAYTKTREAARLEGYALTDRASNALAGFPAMGMQATGAGAGFGASGLGLANSGLTGMNSGLTSAGAMAGQMGQNATGMFGAQASYKNGADQVAASNDPMNTMLGAAAGAGMSYAMKSDRRLKENIVGVGTDADTGLPLYEFAYISGTGQRYRGVMADEVEVNFPDAVFTMPDGFKAVNYAALGIEMVAV
jgi:hypothetical protein